MKKIFYSIFFALMLSMVMHVPVTAQKTRPSLNHVALYIVDLKKSTAFYSDLMQLEVIPEPFHDGKHTWYKVGEHSMLHIIQGAAAVSPHDMNTHLCFSMASVDAFIPRLTQLNIKYFNAKGEPQAITTRVDGVKQIYFQDPDGFWVEVNDDKF